MQLRTTNRKQAKFSHKISWLKPEGIAPNGSPFSTGSMYGIFLPSFGWCFMILISWDHLGHARIIQPQSPRSAHSHRLQPPLSGPPGSWQLDLRFFFIRIQAGSQPANKLVKMLLELPNVSGTASGEILTYIRCMDTAYVMEKPSSKMAS